MIRIYNKTGKPISISGMKISSTGYRDLDIPYDYNIRNMVRNRLIVVKELYMKDVDDTFTEPIVIDRFNTYPEEEEVVSDASVTEQSIESPEIEEVTPKRSRKSTKENNKESEWNYASD